VEDTEFALSFQDFYQPDLQSSDGDRSVLDETERKFGVALVKVLVKSDLLAFDEVWDRIRKIGVAKERRPRTGMEFSQ
jgi:hypothetical protein